MKPRSGKVGTLLLLILGIVILALILIFGLFDRIFNDAQTDISDGNSTYGDEILYYNSRAYVRRESSETILFIGLDAQGAAESLDTPHLADFLMLAIIDHEAATVRFLHLNRDTMAYVSQLDHADKPSATLYTQLARGHIFGSNETVRCHNTVKAVEHLLYDIDIDHYVSMTMDAVSVINDAVGGITLPLLADFSHVDPAYIKGAEVTFDGSFALKYIRARGEMEDKTNLARMERQKQYMEQLLMQYLSRYAEDSGLQSSVIIDAAKYLYTDLTVYQLTHMGEKIRDYTFLGTESIAGEAVLGDAIMEYYVDETSLQETVLALFYREYNES